MNPKSSSSSEHSVSVAKATRRLDENPQDILALMDRANAFMDKRDAISALRDVERALQLIQMKFTHQISDEIRQTVLAKLYTLQSRAFSGLGDLSAASRAIDRALEANATDFDAITQRGRLRREAGRFEDALEDFNRVITIDNRFAPAHVGKGMVLQAMGNPHAAITEYDIALDIDEHLGIAWSSRGNAYFDLRGFDKAESDLLKALQIDPYLSWAYVGLSQILRLRGDSRKALSIINTGLKYHPQDPAMLVLVARIYVDQGNFSDAASLLNSVLEKDTQNGDALSVRGQIHGRLGKMKEAIGDLERAAELNPKDSENLFNLAIAYVHDKNPNAATHVLERFIQLVPNDVEARSLLEKLVASK